jgi:hypothetical protein
MATHSTIQVAPDATGPLVDFVTLPSGGRRQTMTLSNPTIDDADAQITNADPATSDWAMVVREAPAPNTVHALLATASTNATVVKSSPGRVYRISVYNTTSTILFVKFHNVITTPTAGTTTVFFPVPCQAGTWTHLLSTNGMEFTTGIAYTTVTTLAASGSTGVTAESLVIIVERK